MFLSKKTQKKSLANELEAGFFGFTFSHNRCAAHIINLVVKAGLRYLDTSIIKLLNYKSLLLKYEIHHYYSMLSKAFVILKTNFLMPIQDIDTRWNSTYKIIERQIFTRDVMEILVNSYEDI